MHRLFDQIELQRPLAVLDIESTGTDVAKDRIISLAVQKFWPADLADRRNRVESREWLVNPGVPISKGATRAHGITDDAVAYLEPFCKVAADVHRVLSHCDLCGYNVMGFDIPMLWEEFARCGIEWDLARVHVVDVMAIYKRKFPRTLTAALFEYCGREHDGAHNAMADVAATAEVLSGQLDKHADLGGMNVAGLAEYSCDDSLDGEPVTRVDLAGLLVRDAAGVVRFTLKKVRGVAVQDDLGFARWMLKADFTENTKLELRRVMESV